MTDTRLDSCAASTDNGHLGQRQSPPYTDTSTNHDVLLLFSPWEIPILESGQTGRVDSRAQLRVPVTVALIGMISSPAQGTGYFERNGYCAEDDPA